MDAPLSHEIADLSRLSLSEWRNIIDRIAANDPTLVKLDLTGCSRLFFPLLFLFLRFGGGTSIGGRSAGRTGNKVQREEENRGAWRALLTCPQD